MQHQYFGNMYLYQSLIYIFIIINNLVFLLSAIMAKWISLLIFLLLLHKTLSLNGSCSCGKSAAGGEQITCQNVTQMFFQQTQLNLSRAHWFACENCILTTLMEDTFKFPRNNISVLLLNGTQIHYIGNFAFKNMPLLRTLDLSDNLIDTIDYKGLYDVRKLLHLDLSKNKLKQILSYIFSDLYNLDILNLNENSIALIETEAFSGLKNLQYLYLSKNKLTYLQPNTFKHLTRLKILYLENNGMKEIHPYALNSLSSLNHLYLNNNSIHFLVQYSFKELTSLVELQLSYNNLSEIQTSSFNGLRNIKYLYLSHNNISYIKPYGFIGLNSLLILDLIGNYFKNFTLESLNGMEYITALWLESNHISNLSVTKNTDTFNSFKVLNLLDNNLDVINFKFLHIKMPKLQQIIIGSNLWKCSFVVQMYEYYQSNNVSICLNHKCALNDTENFIEDICKELYEQQVNETEVSSDFALDTCTINYLSFNVLFAVILFIYYCK